jgi:hypothetical protein
VCLLGNVMWSDELQSLKLFDLQFTGKAPAVCDIAYLLGPSMGARDSDYNRRFVTAIKQYTAAISAAGVDYGEENDPFFPFLFNHWNFLVRFRSIGLARRTASNWQQSEN